MNDLLKSLMSAAMDANRELHDHEIRALRNHFKQNEKDGYWEPNTVKMKLPQKHIQAGDELEQPVDIPTGALASHHSMLIEELELDFDCYVQRIATMKSGNKKIMVDIDSPEKEKKAKNKMAVKLKIKSGDPSEGISKIHDSLNKKIG
ncbi:MAG: DUF2589 domain-containing protein [Balneola sp.]